MGTLHNMAGSHWCSLTGCLGVFHFILPSAGPSFLFYSPHFPVSCSSSRQVLRSGEKTEIIHRPEAPGPAPQASQEACRATGPHPGHSVTGRWADTALVICPCRHTISMCPIVQVHFQVDNYVWSCTLVFWMGFFDPSVMKLAHHIENHVNF